MATTEVQFSAEDLKAAQSAERIPEPTVVVIFGASGDLTKRKLLKNSHGSVGQQNRPLLHRLQKIRGREGARLVEDCPQEIFLGGDQAFFPWIIGEFMALLEGVAIHLEFL